MILRIEIYEDMTDEQVQQIRDVLTSMGAKDITVERLSEYPEADGDLSSFDEE